jgi:hypothetical protein
MPLPGTYLYDVFFRRDPERIIVICAHRSLYVLYCFRTVPSLVYFLVTVPKLHMVRS